MMVNLVCPVYFVYFVNIVEIVSIVRMVGSVNNGAGLRGNTSAAIWRMELRSGTTEFPEKSGNSRWKNTLTAHVPYGIF